jgi:Fe2+ transport system protein FeoA
MHFRPHHARHVAAGPHLHRLSDLQSGQSGKIAEIRGGWHLRQSLNQVGIHISDSFRVERGVHLGGPILIHIHSTQVALGHGMAEKIIVRIDEE